MQYTTLYDLTIRTLYVSLELLIDFVIAGVLEGNRGDCNTMEK